MRTPEDVLNNAKAFEIEIDDNLAGSLDRLPLWELEPASARAAEMIRRLAGEYGPDHPAVTRLVVMRRKLVAAIEKVSAEVLRGDTP